MIMPKHEPIVEEAVVVEEPKVEEPKVEEQPVAENIGNEKNPVIPVENAVNPTSPIYQK